MKKFVLLLVTLGLISCGESKPKQANFEDKLISELDLTEKELYDKVLGMLVGSAYGDAMGAPTEMWSRENIQLEYGFVSDLDSMVREVSPEGVWKSNLDAGGTTDDTRWKNLTFLYLLKQNSRELNAKSFAQHLVDEYQHSIDNYAKIKSFDPKPFEENTLRVAWLQEWAKVAKPYTENNLDAYSDATAKFYGGEMVCAGLLYAPAIGCFYPSNPTRAYEEMYKLSIFDIGYARDISSLAAALTAAAMKKNTNKNEVLAVLRSTDPKHYFESRLVGRTSFRIYRNVLSICNEGKKDTTNSLKTTFRLLDNYQQDMPFHAGEIYQQVLTAMLFTDFDFLKTIQFLVNYGRDNDTTSAIAGGILGAFHGYAKLPADKLKVIKTTKEQLGIDLEQLAIDLTHKIIELNR